MSHYVDYINATLRPKITEDARVLDLFAGCGGLSLGFEAAGFETIGFEMVPAAADTYNRNLKGTCFNTKLEVGFDYPDADIIIGGPPCQPFSVRGKQLGMQDARDGFPIFIDAVKRLNPSVFLFENVRNLAYSHKWYFFRFPKVEMAWATVGDAIGDTMNKVIEGCHFLTPAQDRYIAEYEKKSACINPRDLYADRPARTITCRNLAGATSDMQRVRLADGRRRRIVQREAARLQSFPDWFEFCGNETQQFTQIGNAVPPLLAYRMALAIKEAFYLTVNEEASQERQKILKQRNLFDTVCA